MDVRREITPAPSLAGELIGILAGWGRYPVAVAEAIRRRGGRTAILAIRDLTERRRIEAALTESLRDPFAHAFADLNDIEV